MAKVIGIPLFLTAIVTVMLLKDCHSGPRRIVRHEPNDGPALGGGEEIDEHSAAYSLYKSRLFIVAFLVYPTVCKQSFSMLNCRQLGKGLLPFASVLRSDYSIDCNSPDHKRMEYLAYAVIVCFVLAVPVDMTRRLWRDARRRTVPEAHEDMGEEERLKLEARRAEMEQHLWISTRLAATVKVGQRNAGDAIRDLSRPDGYSFLNTFKVCPSLPQHGPSSNKMALITSGCDETRIHEHQNGPNHLGMWCALHRRRTSSGSRWT